MSDILPRLMSADEARDCLDEIRVGTLSVKAKLIELHEGRGWEALGYESWRACVTTELQIGTSQAYRLLDAAYIAQEISPIGENVTESQARELKKAPKEKRVETLAKAKESAAAQGRGKPTAKDIRDAVEQGSGTKPPHDAPQQEVEEARMLVTDGEDGPCPKGGEHDIFTLHGERYCGRCKTRFSADDESEVEAEFVSTYQPAREFVEPVYVDQDSDYDTTSLDEFCRWTIDQCETHHREKLAQRLTFWANEAKG